MGRRVTRSLKIIYKFGSLGYILKESGKYGLLQNLKRKMMQKYLLLKNFVLKSKQKHLLLIFQKQKNDAENSTNFDYILKVFASKLKKKF